MFTWCWVMFDKVMRPWVELNFVVLVTLGHLAGFCQASLRDITEDDLRPNSEVSWHCVMFDKVIHYRLKSRIEHHDLDFTHVLTKKTVHVTSLNFGQDEWAISEVSSFIVPFISRSHLMMSNNASMAGDAQSHVLSPLMFRPMVTLGPQKD
jgi:hypothetical protein